MKRWIFSFIVFPVALVISLIAFHIITSEDDHIEVFTFRVPTMAKVSVDPTGTDFKPEFTNLPNLADIEFPEWNERLIDTYQIGNVFRESEVVARRGQSWLVLFERDSKYEIVSTRAKVKKLNTTSWPGDEKDVRLTFDKTGVPIFAVRNFKSIRPGEIISLYQRPSSDEIDRRGLEIDSMSSSYNKDLVLAETRYRLKVSSGLAKDGTKLSVLVLETGNKKQVILSDQLLDQYSDMGNLLWAGDLDRDGVLDLMIEPYSEKGGLGSFLFLSSEAEDGALVKLAAAFGVAGC